MENKRKLKRRHLIYYLRVFNKKGNKLLGHLVDLTTEGIMLIGEEPVKSGAQLNLKMQLPREIEGKRQVSFNAECIWCRKDINPDFYDSGFKLVKIGPKDVKRIENLILLSSFKD